MRHGHKGSAVTHAAKSCALKHSPSISSFTLLFLSLLLYKDSTKLIQSPVNSFFFFFFVVRKYWTQPRSCSAQSISQTPAASVISWFIQEVVI